MCAHRVIIVREVTNYGIQFSKVTGLCAFVSLCANNWGWRTEISLLGSCIRNSVILSCNLLLAIRLWTLPVVHVHTVNLTKYNCQFDEGPTIGIIRVRWANITLVLLLPTHYIIYCCSDQATESRIIIAAKFKRGLKLATHRLIILYVYHTLLRFCSNFVELQIYCDM